MAERERSAIGGLSGDMDKAAQEIEGVLGKFDWSNMTSDQHTEFTSKLYSIVQQKTDPKLQKNTSRERERSSDR